VWEGRKECRGYRKSNRKRYRKTDVPVYIQTGRNINTQTYTNEQTYRWTVRKCWYRAKNRHAYRQINIHTYCTYPQYCTYVCVSFSRGLKGYYTERAVEIFVREKKILFLVFGVDLIITYVYFTCPWYCLSSMC
jgi:hypothetical protein